MANQPNVRLGDGIDTKSMTREDVDSAVKQQLAVLFPASHERKIIGGPGYNLPLTPQTDKTRFPDYNPGSAAYRPYPRMILRTVTDQDVDEWVKRNRKYDRRTGEEWWDDKAPRAGDLVEVKALPAHVANGWSEGVGFPLIARNEDEENFIYATLGIEKPKDPNERHSSVSVDEINKLVAENQRLKDLIEENAKLRAQAEDRPPMASVPSVKAKPKHIIGKRRGRPPKPSTGPGVALGDLNSED